MKFEINEQQFYSIKEINQIKNYETKLSDGVAKDNLYKTSLHIKLEFLNNNLDELTEEFVIPIEIDMLEKDLVNFKMNNCFINVVDNQGIDLNYEIEVEVKEKDSKVQFEVAEDNVVENVEESFDVDSKYEEVTKAYENLIEKTDIRESNVNVVQTDELNELSLLDDYMTIKILFNIDLDNIDKVAFKYHLTVDECYKKLSIDKTRLFV